MPLNGISNSVGSQVNKGQQQGQKLQQQVMSPSILLQKPAALSDTSCKITQKSTPESFLADWCSKLDLLFEQLPEGHAGQQLAELISDTQANIYVLNHCLQQLQQQNEATRQAEGIRHAKSESLLAKRIEQLESTALEYAILYKSSTV